MTKKKSENSSKTPKEVNIHYYRFAQFLQYLGENNAVIKTVNPDNGGSFTYSDNKEVGGLPLQNLISEALDLGDQYAKDIMSRRLTPSNISSNKERMRGDGDLLYGITVHKTVSDDPDEPQVPIRSINYQYYHRKSYSKPSRFDLSTTNTEANDEGDKRREFTNDHEMHKAFINYVNESVNRYVTEQDIFSQMAGVNFVKFPMFEAPILQLEEMLNKYNDQTNEVGNDLQLKHELLKLTRVYNQVSDRHNIQNSIIPYYRDFAILSSDELTERCISLYSEDQSADFLEKATSFSPEEIIYFRYEILKKLIANQENVREWPTQFQALLMLCNYELEGVHVLLTEIINSELSRIRYTVLTKDSYKDGRYQQSNLNNSQLHEILREYDINEPVDDIFSLSGNHIMSTVLYKYPDEYAVDYNYSSSEIQIELNQILKEFISEKLYEGLNMDEGLLPTDSESAILL